VFRDSRPPLLAEFSAFFLITAALLGEAAISNAATGGESESTTGQLQEIIVTAQKRAEDIKDIPFSVSAISGAELAEHHVANYDDITRTVPGISFQAGPGPGLDNIEIRGVSSTSGSATVGIYIDEVSVTVSNSQYDGAVQPKLFDLDRIEVLRGPQGTLYGASSMGGTIRFITKQPDLHSFSASVSTDLSKTHHGGFNNDE
jgi:iron complex outermembrane recepter protein